MFFQIHLLTAKETLKTTNLINNNTFMFDNDGVLYLYYNNSIFYNYNKEGDGWSRIKKDIKSIAIDPVHNDIYYIITSNNIVQKKIGDDKYISIMNGLPKTIFNVIIVNPYNTNEIFIGSQSGVYRTKDAGFNWEHFAFNKYIYNFLISTTEKETFIILTNKGLYSSINAGKSWNRIDLNLPKRILKGAGRSAQEVPMTVNMVAYTNDKRERLLVSTPSGLFISDDNGKIWNKITGEIDKISCKSCIKSFYSNKSNYYIGAKQSIYKSQSYGNEWKKVNLSDRKYHIGNIIGLAEYKKNGLILNDDNGNIFYYRNGGKIISLNSGVLTHSEIKALSSKKISDTANRIYAFVENNYYVDINTYGIFFSEDNGLTWRKSLTYEKPYYAKPRFYISPITDEIWHFIDSDNMLFYSEDVGSSWSKIKHFNFKYMNDNIADFDFDPIRPNIKYICAGVNDYSIFRYDQNTQNSMDLKVNSTKMMIASDDNLKLLTNSLHISTDGGWNWANLSNNLNKVAPGNKFLPIYFNKNDILIYLNNYDSYYKNGKHYLILSNDLGRTWKIIKTIEGHMVHLVYVNPEDNNSIFLVLDNTKYGNDSNRLEVILSTDRGLTWKTIFEYYLPKNNNIRDNSQIIQCITVSKNDGYNSFFIGGTTGLRRSVDGGKTWEILGGIK